MSKRRKDWTREDRRERLRGHLLSTRWEPGAATAALEHLLAYPDALLRARVERWLGEDIGISLECSLQLAASADIAERHRGLIALRKFLIADVNVAQTVIDADALGSVLNAAQLCAYPHLQWEAMCCLGALAGGDDVRALTLVRRGAVSALLEGVTSPFTAIVEQSVGGLAVLCSGLTEARRAFLRANGISLVESVWERPSAAVKNAVVRLFARICRNRINGESLETVLTPLRKIIYCIAEPTSLESETLFEAIAGASQCIKEASKALYENGAFLANVCAFYRAELSSPTLSADRISVFHRIFGALTNLSDDFTEALLAERILECFAVLLSGAAALPIKKEVCWILCNVAMGTHSQSARLCGALGLLDALFALTANADNEMSKEALWVVCCLCKCGQRPLVAELFQRGILAVFLASLCSSHSAKICLVLEALTALLNFAENGEKSAVRAALVDAGIADEVERLQLSEDFGVYFKARKVLVDHFPLEH